MRGMTRRPPTPGGERASRRALAAGLAGVILVAVAEWALGDAILARGAARPPGAADSVRPPARRADSPGRAAAAAAPGPAAGSARGFDHSAFDRLLRANVRDGRVDYLAIRERSWGDLNHYLDQVAATDTGALSRDEQLALEINLYNATMIRAVIERYRAGWSPAESGFAVFREPRVRLGGRALSLDALENQLIRPGFQDPRVHAALVCAARSCPPILPRAYRAEDLDSTLEENMARFVADTTRNRVDPGARRLMLSAVFKWYAADFGPAGPAAYFDRFHPAAVADYRVSYLDYDWTLNLAPPATGHWVRITADSTPLYRSPRGAERIATAARGEVFAAPQKRERFVLVVRPFGAGTAWVDVQRVAAFAP